MKKVDTEAFRADLIDAYESMSIHEGDEFETMYAQYHHASSEVVKKHAPTQKFKCTTDQPQWMDQEYKQNRRLRRTYERKWKKERTEMNKTKYIEQKKSVPKWY